MVIRYSDISLFAQQTNSALVFNEQAINQNIVLILMTPIRSCWFMPSLGSMIPQYLFDPIDEVTALKIEREAKAILARNGEYRITVDTVNVRPNPNENYYDVRIVYRAPSLGNKPTPFNFSMAA